MLPLVALLSLLSAAVPSLALPSNTSDTSSAAICTRATYTLPIAPHPTIPFTSSLPLSPNQTLTTALIQQYITSPSNFSATYSPGAQGTSTPAAYALSGVLCVPRAGDKHQGTIQLLVHGVGFDSSYWDFAYEPSTYSYVEAAANAGYATFRYDRLGTGQSAFPPDGFHTVQAPTDLAILEAFASLLRSGNITRTANLPVPTHIVGVGHSYGSLQLAALSKAQPNAIDALVLTGYSANSSAVSTFIAGGAYSLASTVFPDRFSSLPGTYLVAGLPQASQNDFFFYPQFDQQALDTARATEAPVTQGVLYSMSALGVSSSSPSSFAGPVHVVTGDRDVPFCLAECDVPLTGMGGKTILELTAGNFPNAREYSIYSPAGTGHALNMHYSAPDTYREVMSWIEAAGF